MALNKNGKLIIADQANVNENYFCPHCQEKVRLRISDKVTTHFAHLINSDCKSLSEGETKVHLMGKKQIYAFFSPYFKIISLERYLKGIKQRPDIMIDSNKVIEYQCSPITTKRLIERLNGYKQLKIKSYWILGPKYYSKHLSRKMCQQFMMYSKNLGFFLLFWNVKKSCLIIRFSIRTINSSLSYQEKCFYSWYSYLSFISNHSLEIIHSNLNDLIYQTQKIQNKINRHQMTTLNIQELCYERNHNLLGCPLVCHYPLVEVPYFYNQIIEIRVVIILILENSPKSFNEILIELNQYFKFSNEFCMLKFNLFELIVNRFINFLMVKRIVKSSNGELILIRPLKWYRSSEEKIKKIKILAKST